MPEALNLSIHHFTEMNFKELLLREGVKNIQTSLGEVSKEMKKKGHKMI